MSKERFQLDEARHLWDNAIEAIEKLRYVKEETLREIAKSRTRMPVIVFGQKGRIGKGITVADYTKNLELGSELPVKANLPKGGLRAYILEYIDRVSMLKAGDEPKQKTAKPTQEEIDHGIEDYLQDELNIEWLQDVNAFRLPPLSKETLTRWADHIAEAIKVDAWRYAGYEIVEIDGKEQRFTPDLPLEIQKLVSKNYRKAIKEKIGRVPELAARRAENSASFPEMIDEWKAFYAENPLSNTWIIDFESSAIREAIGKALLEIVTGSP
jgi:hypothetical protein